MKKIMRSLAQGALVLSLTVAGISCKKDSDSITPDTKGKNISNRIADGVELHNGRLVFQDMEAFKNYMSSLHNLPMEEIIANDAGNELPSLREHYEAIDGVGEDAEVTTDQLFESGQLLHVPDSRFATILNEDGVFQIGEEIHKITQNMEYIISNGDEAILANSDWENPNVVKFDIAFTSTTASADSTDGGKIGMTNPNGSTKPTNQNARTGNFIGWYSKTKDKDINGNILPATSNGRPTRLFGAQWNVTYAAYTSHGVRSKFEYKTRFAGWVDNQCSYIRAEGDSRATMWFTNTSSTVNSGLLYDHRSNKATTEKTLFYAAGAGVWINLHWSYSTHNATYKGAQAVLGL